MLHPFLWILLNSLIETKVINLTEENYVNILTTIDPLLVFYHVPNCKPCEELKTVFQSLEKRIDLPVTLSELDCEVHKNITKKLELEWFPIVSLYKNRTMDVYKGERDTESLYSWINKKLKGSIQPFLKE